MKLSELRVCDCCGGKLVRDGSIQFFTVNVGSEIIDHRALNQVASMLQLYHGNVALAEVMAPESEVTKAIPPTKLLVCFECFCKPQILASLIETRNDREEESRRTTETEARSV